MFAWPFWRINKHNATDEGEGRGVASAALFITLPVIEQAVFAGLVSTPWTGKTPEPAFAKSTAIELYAHKPHTPAVASFRAPSNRLRAVACIRPAPRHRGRLRSDRRPRTGSDVANGN
jgi:hypothetical protein